MTSAACMLSAVGSYPDVYSFLRNTLRCTAITDSLWRAVYIPADVKHPLPLSLSPARCRNAAILAPLLHVCFHSFRFEFCCGVTNSTKKKKPLLSLVICQTTYFLQQLERGRKKKSFRLFACHGSYVYDSVVLCCADVADTHSEDTVKTAFALTSQEMSRGRKGDNWWKWYSISRHIHFVTPLMAESGPHFVFMFLLLAFEFLVKALQPKVDQSHSSISRSIWLEFNSFRARKGYFISPIKSLQNLLGGLQWSTSDHMTLTRWQKLHFHEGFYY